ncbi:TPA: glutamate racemase [bacterium]|nr:glutamate racemase [bacterium]
MNEKPIGIFDSGIGGLTVVKEIKKLLPREDIIYFGDIGRAPYGSKSESLIVKYSKETLSFLLKNDIKLVVVACNTSASVSISTLKKIFPNIIDVVEPVVDEAVKLAKKAIGVIGTKRTIFSGIYERKIKEKKPEIEVFSKACPLFVPLVEEGWTNSSITKDICKKYLHEFIGKIDVLILGCTHYPLLENTIEEVIGNGIILVNSSKATAFSTKAFLDKKDLLNTSGGRTIFYTSDEPEEFKRLGSLFLQTPIYDNAEMVEL